MKPQTPPRKLDLTPEDPHWVCIASNALHWDIYLFLGEGNIMPSGGGGGFTTVSRADDVDLTDWSGMPPWRLAVPIMLDSWTEDLDPPNRVRRKDPPSYLKGRDHRKERQKWRRYRDEDRPHNVEHYVELINLLSQPASHPEGEMRPRDEPPPMRIYGIAMPHWLNGHEFVVEAIDWGEYAKGPRGKLRRQQLTLNVIRRVDRDNYKTKKRRGRQGNNEGGRGGKQPRHYVVKQGDTLMTIAAKFYGDWHEWGKIAKVNDIKNPRSLTPGTRLKIP